MSHLLSMDISESRKVAIFECCDCTALVAILGARSTQVFQTRCGLIRQPGNRMIRDECVIKIQCYGCCLCAYDVSDTNRSNIGN